MRGNISTEHTVWCGICQNWEQVAIHTLRHSRREFLRLGWVYTRKDGWICPTCHQTGRKKEEETL